MQNTVHWEKERNYHVVGLEKGVVIMFGVVLSLKLFAFQIHQMPLQ